MWKFISNFLGLPYEPLNEGLLTIRGCIDIHFGFFLFMLASDVVEANRLSISYFLVSVVSLYVISLPKDMCKVKVNFPG